VNKQGGVIALSPQKGSMFTTVEWFWQNISGHDMKPALFGLVVHTGKSARVELADFCS
jgi:hypothetical protein